jgi:hypothetical protein
MMKKIFISCGLLLGIFACTSPQPINPNEGIPKPQASPTPKPTPTPPEMLWTCKFLNGEGRTFQGVDPSRYSAENKAHDECTSYSRNCIFLDCRLAAE